MISRLSNLPVVFGSDAGKKLNKESARLLDTYASKNESDKVINTFIEATDTFLATANKGDTEDINAASNFNSVLKVCERVEKGFNYRGSVLFALAERVKGFLKQ
ncbi:MAG: hypothetical protein AB1782_08025 [Cyanobacteriota bacterium]